MLQTDVVGKIKTHSHVQKVFFSKPVLFMR